MYPKGAEAKQLTIVFNHFHAWKLKFTIMAKSFATKNNDTRLMIEGLKANKEAVARMGIDDEFINKLETQNNAVKKADVAQEKAKADLDTATKAVKDADKERTKSYNFARKVVKLALPEDRWKEFGIDSKM